MHGADDLAGPYQPWQRKVPANALCPLGVPAEVPGGVERIALACGVVIHHVLAGELGRDVGVRAVPTRRPCEDIGFVAPDPLQFRPDRLARQHRARTLQDGIGAQFRCQQVDLDRSAGIHAVEDRGPQWPQRVVAQHEARADTADTDRGHGRSLRHLRGQRAADVTDLAPPHRLGVDLGPAGTGQLHRMRHRLRGHDCTGRVDQKPFRAPGPHVDSEQQLHDVTLSVARRRMG